MKRPTIGFLINDIVGAYQFSLWSGIDTACRAFDINLVVFTGGEVGSKDPVKAVRSHVFNLANASNVDGLIISAPAVGNHLSTEQIIEYCRSFAHLPVVTVALELPGIPSVLVDNVAGMEAAVEHLIKVHNRHRIAFIGGPPANSEALARFGAYRRMLERHGIAFDPKLEEVANFDRGLGRHAMKRLLLADRSIDAVVAANDDMALGALEALQEAGIKVPEKIALCGFDDIDDTKFCYPPLFTVRQPLVEQGYKSVEVLRKLLEGSSVSVSPVVIPAFPVYRKSCGCAANDLSLDELSGEELRISLEKRLSDAEASIQKQSFEMVMQERRIRELQELSANLVNTFDINALIELLAKGVSDQGIPTSYLILGPDESKQDEEPRLIMAIEDGVSFPLPKNGLPIPKGALFPEGYSVHSRLNLIVEPLFFLAIPLGFFIYSMKPCRGMIFDAMRTTISAALQGARLVHQLRMRTEEVERTNIRLQDVSQKVHDILNNIEQGLFTINLDGSINPEHSRSALSILSIPDILNTPLRDVMRLSGDQECDFLKWLNLVKMKHGSMRWEKLLRLAPVQHLEIGIGETAHFIRITYQKMYDGHKNLQKIMVLAIDETESHRIEQVVAAERGRHENEVRTILGLVNNLPEIIQDYLRDTEARIDTVTSTLQAMFGPAKFARQNYPDAAPFIPPSEEILAICRDIHTIKGNSATYGFEALSQIAHEAEDLIMALMQPIEMRVTFTLGELLEKTTALRAAFDEIIAVQHRLNSSGDPNMVHITETRIENIRFLARDIIPKLRESPFLETVTPLIEACLHVRDVSLRKLVEKYKNLIFRVSNKLGKKVEFETVPADLERDPHFFSHVDGALVHLLRNSLDHGLETPLERKALNKSETGKIVLELISGKEFTTIRITDDGRGIDVERVVAKALATGLITPQILAKMSFKEKLEFIFVPGLSTASEVTDISGRGIGMAAVRKNIASLNGSINVSTERNRGTTVEIKIPV